MNSGSTVEDVRPIMGMNRQALYSSLRGNISCEEVSVFDTTRMCFKFEEFLVELPSVVSGSIPPALHSTEPISDQTVPGLLSLLPPGGWMTFKGGCVWIV